jgi:hypothetical protein
MGSIRIGTVVWAKFRGYPWWPSKVESEENLSSKFLSYKPKTPLEHIPVYVYGKEKYAWANTKYIRPFERYKDIFITGKRTEMFDNAIKKALSDTQQIAKSNKSINLSNSINQTIKSPSQNVKQDPTEFSNVYQTPNLNVIQSPSLVVNQSPNVVTNQTPNMNSNQTPSVVTNQTPNMNLNQTPSIVTNQTPNMNLNQTPSIVTNQTPNMNSNQTPNVVTNQTPNMNSNQTPTINTHQTPSIMSPSIITNQTPTSQINQTPNSNSNISQTQNINQNPVSTNVNEKTPNAETGVPLVPVKKEISKTPKHNRASINLQSQASSSSPETVKSLKLKENEELAKKFEGNELAEKVVKIRIKLQKIMKRDLNPQILKYLSTQLSELEKKEYYEIDLDLLKFSKIGKVIKYLANKKVYPSDDKYNIKNRCLALYNCWRELVNIHEKNLHTSATNNGPTSPAIRSDIGTSNSNHYILNTPSTYSDGHYSYNDSRSHSNSRNHSSYHSHHHHSSYHHHSSRYNPYSYDKISHSSRMKITNDKEHQLTNQNDQNNDDNGNKGNRNENENRNVLNNDDYNLINNRYNSNSSPSHNYNNSPTNSNFYSSPPRPTYNMMNSPNLKSYKSSR